jgi:Ubiquitin-activating enzyme E1 FCCH domain
MTVISFPIPPYQNVPINAQFFQPSRFLITAISLGETTLITTSVQHNYVIAQLVRLIIPQAFGSFELNEQEGYVIEIPNPNQVVVTINSMNADPFIPFPYVANITGVTNSNPTVITAINSFKMGENLTITQVEGMTQLNGENILIIGANSTTITVAVDSTLFGIYISGGIATVQLPVIAVAQILPVGDINSGATNSSGRTNNITFIPGSFRNISPV